MQLNTEGCNYLKMGGWDKIETERLSHLLLLQGKANERSTEKYKFSIFLSVLLKNMDTGGWKGNFGKEKQAIIGKAQWLCFFFLFGIGKDGIEISHFNTYLVSTYSAGHQDEPDMVLPIIKKREE